MTRVAFVVLVGVSGGCVPHVSHAPRVEPGTRFFINTAAVHAPDLQGEDFAILPSLYVGAAHAWVSPDSNAAFSVGAQIPIFLLPLVLDRSTSETLLATSFLDFYVQPNRAHAGGVDYGFGTLLSASVVMPYVQVGGRGDNSVFTTQGVAFTYGDLNPVTYWMPAVVLRSERPDGRRAVDVYLNAAVDMNQDRSESYVGFGVVFTF